MKLTEMDLTREYANHKESAVFSPEPWMCCTFAEPDAAAAWDHLSAEYILEYGSECDGHPLHTWDKGDRTLARCKRCGKLLLIQYSEYNDFIADEDSTYVDIWPVKSEEEAEELNRRYNGYTLETAFDRRALFLTNGKADWHGNN